MALLIILLQDTIMKTSLIQLNKTLTIRSSNDYFEINCNSRYFLFMYFNINVASLSHSNNAILHTIIMYVFSNLNKITKLFIQILQLKKLSPFIFKLKYLRLILIFYKDNNKLSYKNTLYCDLK